MSRTLEGDLGSWPSNVALCQSWDTDLVEASALGMSGPSDLLSAFEAGPRWLPVFVDGNVEPCRTVAFSQRWRLAWSPWSFSRLACSSWLLKILKAKFKRSHWGVWGPSSTFFSFFWISGDYWEIKWVLRTMVPSVKVGSNLIYFCTASVNLVKNCAQFSSSPWIISWTLSKLTILCPAFWRPTMWQATIWLWTALPGLPPWKS